jgi:hypothetical protein
MIWARINEFTKSAIEKLWPYTQNALKVLYKISFCYDVLCYASLCCNVSRSLCCVVLCYVMFYYVLLCKFYQTYGLYRPAIAYLPNKNTKWPILHGSLALLTKN